MNKKVNTLLFILGATVFNILVTVLSFIILILLYGRFIMPLLPDTSGSWGVSVIFIVSIVASFLLYRFLLKFLLKKIDAEKYFDPLFARKYKKN